MSKFYKYATPEECGISSEKILDVVKTLDDYKFDTHSLIIARGDRIIYESYYAPYDENSLQRMYSISKSFVAAAAGFAISDGLFTLEDKMVDFFPEYTNGSQDEALCDVTIKNLLTMSTSMAKYAIWWEKPDRAEAYFSVKSNQHPDTNFSYDSAGSFILACIIEKLTGKLMVDYLREKGFSDFGFSDSAYSLLAPGGHSHADSGVMCTTRDLYSFAYLILNNGKIKDKQYLDAKYVKDMKKKQADVHVSHPFSDHGEGYGYLVWKIPRDGFAFFGMADQFAFCDPATDMIFIITSENHSLGGITRQLLIHIFENDLVKNVSDTALTENCKAYQELSEYAKGRRLASYTNKEISPIAKKINGKKYILDENPAGIKNVRFFFSDDRGIMEYENAEGLNKLEFGLGYNIFSKLPGKKRMSLTASVYEDGAYDCATSGEWASENILRICARVIDTYIGKWVLSVGFTDKGISFHSAKHAQRILDNLSFTSLGKSED